MQVLCLKTRHFRFISTGILIIFTTVAYGEDMRHLGNKNEKKRFSFCISLDLHYLCPKCTINKENYEDKNCIDNASASRIRG